MISLRELLAEDTGPDRVHLYAVLRALERNETDKPRIGRSEVVAQDVARIEQEPFLNHPASTLQGVEFRVGEAPRVSTPVLGYFGPHGALPLILSAEAQRWSDHHDDSFVRFANVFATRFLQLFYRAWADARPITHADRPDEDRFADWVGALVGIGTPATSDRDTLPDALKRGHAGLLMGRVGSARRLVQTVEAMLGVSVEVRERAGLWLEFEPNDLTRLGAPGAALGQRTTLGARCFSINDKAVIALRTEDIDTYRKFLPGGEGHGQLRDLVRFMFGDQIDFDLELQLPADQRPAAQLGASGQLGWTAWTAPPPTDPDTPPAYVGDATFRLTGAGAGP